MAIGDIRPQEVQAIEVEAPHVIADMQPAAEIRVVVPLTQAAVPHRGAALLHPCRQQQLTLVQFMDKAYNPSLSKKKMKLKWKVNSRPISSATTKSSPKHSKGW